MKGHPRGWPEVVIGVGGLGAGVQGADFSDHVSPVTAVPYAGHLFLSLFSLHRALRGAKRRCPFSSREKPCSYEGRAWQAHGLTLNNRP